VSVTAPRGFSAAAVACGIKATGALDLALVTTDDGTAVPAAAVVTQNKAAAAPVVITRSHLVATNGRAAAVIVNSGNANAATGGPGTEDATRMCAMVAERLGRRVEEVLVCSTGLIGLPLPMDAIEAGIAAVTGARHAGGGPDAARAIMTTDTHPKQVVVEGDGWTIGGMAKGAAMLAPNMATMLAVLTTDAVVAPTALADHLHDAVAGSFNALSVDGCTSTNDTVIVLASGRATGQADAGAAFGEALGQACADLAAQMAADAEGATKVVRLVVCGAATDADAAIAARKVAESQLVKCSLYGRDPYWGRVVSELGSSGVRFDPDRVSVSYGGITVAAAGVAHPHDEAAVAAHLDGREVDLTADLGVGHGRAVMLTNDLGHGYIDENATRS
jgi:glutamate N-acetyltransferase/amino-acid N-acetyltransferase